MVTYYICDEALALDKLPFSQLNFGLKREIMRDSIVTASHNFNENCKPDVDHHQLLGVDFVS